VIVEVVVVVGRMVADSEAVTRTPEQTEYFEKQHWFGR
jgi:hypothetical protein